MRSLIVITAALTILGFATSAHAIGLRGGGIKVGGTILVTNFEFEAEKRVNTDTRFGLVFGGFTEWELKRRSAFAFVLEAVYVRKGYEGDRQLAAETSSTDIKVGADYLSIPVLGRVLFSDNDITVYAVFGPSLELLLSNDEDVLLDDFKSWSIAGNVGIGVELEVGSTAKLQLEFRFNTDFTNNYEGPDAQEINNARYQQAMITGGIRF